MKKSDINPMPPNFAKYIDRSLMSSQNKPLLTAIAS
jgi:hypothetical protein